MMMTKTAVAYTPLFTRANDKVRGRHLQASTDIVKGQLILVERPLLALQSLDNLPVAWTCSCCKAFVGGPDAALIKRFQPPPSSSDNDVEATPEILANDKNPEEYAVYSCQKACGHVYCSPQCRDDAWEAHHCLLCTGDVPADHPLVAFKKFACQTNEILLLVAEWWVAQHLCNNDECRAPYTDFQMEPWWDVVTAELTDQPGGFATAFGLQESLHEVCREAAALLQKAVTDPRVPAVTEMDVAVRIGACEQNAMGIRQRHALCRAVFDLELRQRRHGEIVKCLAQADFIGNNEGCQDEECNDGDDEAAIPDINGNDQGTEEPQEAAANEAEIKGGEWDYSVDEIAGYFASIFIDEDGTVKDQADAALPDDEQQIRDTQGDDLDYIFPPLDGTALYATACKMNHSCDPNVIVLYKRKGWGAKHPLTAYCIALREIAAGDELSISYIDVDESYAERQDALENYGFRCRCTKCERESATGESGPSVENGRSNEAHLFGKDEEENLFGTDDEDSNAGEDVNEENGDDTDEDGEQSIQQVLQRLDTAANHSRFGSIPMKILAPLSSYVLQTSTSILSELGDELSNLLQLCLDGLRERDFCMCKIAGRDLHSTLYSMLQTDSAWPNASYREAFWCSCLAASIGYAHVCNFVSSLDFLDKGFVLGLPRDDERVCAFFAYVEHHAAGTVIGPYPSSVRSWIPDFREAHFINLVREKGLSCPIMFCVAEVDGTLLPAVFQSQYVSASQPVVMRQLAADWPAVTKWRDLQHLVRRHGHRKVPIELGSILAGNMKEELTQFHSFVELYMAESARKDFWSLADATSPDSSVAFLAQHPLLSQLPSLQDDLDMRPPLCGTTGPSHVYAWMGTGGTRTPLHFDSYDNLFVQLVGAKYVRLYSPTETPKLYVSSESAYGLQGNMSDIDCERENWEKHPAAKQAVYTEVLLLPGDSLYIPARTWHYVRSLSTSVSVNFWFG